ncbi:MAG: hypothetical protein K8T90_20825, partial [Planctomycetes bacterium]|nr:hypothetical protein [Planctomycetota bacterium]
MQRAVVLVIALVLAALLAWAVGQGGDTSGVAVCASIERRLQAGDVAGARREQQNAAGRIPKRVAGYLDAVIALAEGKDDVASAAIESAYAANDAHDDAHNVAHDDWRIVSTLFATRVNGRRRDAGWSALDAYLALHPGDERAL